MGIFKGIYNVKQKKYLKNTQVTIQVSQSNNGIKNFFQNSEDQILRTVKIFLKNLYSKKKTISNYENKFKDQIKKIFNFEKKR